MMQQNQEASYNTDIVHFFLFINSGSGGGIGQKLLKQQIQKIQFTLPRNTKEKQDKQSYLKAHVYFYNMRKNKDVGMQRLKKLVELQKQRTIGIVCGGDGTVMWVVQQFISNGIDPCKVPLAIIPLGTGNDFSRNLNWGGQTSISFTQNSYKQLKKRLLLWSEAQQEFFDLWDVQAQIFDYGKFEIMKDSTSTILPGKIVKKTFSNYFSFGIDGKVGYSFDKYRTKSRIGNLMVYGGLGLLKSITRTKNVKELVSSMVQQKQDDPNPIQSLRNIPSDIRLKNIPQHPNAKTVFKSQVFDQKNQSARQDAQKERMLTDSYLNMLALNIDSFMGGTNQIWNNATSGIKGTEGQKYAQPCSSDGLLEFVGFPSSIGLALEKVITGNARKITQGKGPFVIDFVEHKDENKHRTYLQIDGQFIRFTNPRRITITKSTLVPDGKIKVLRNLKK